MDYQIERRGAGAIFTLNRPDKLNATTPQVWDGLTALLDELEAGGGRYVVITGAGPRAFCAGTDLGTTVALSNDEVANRCDMVRKVLLRLHRSPVLSVAAVNGLAYGGGMELAAACTLRLAVPSARFSVPEIKIAAIPAYGGTQYLPAVLGPAVALDLLLTGRVLGTPEAMTLGFLSRIVEAGADVVAEAVAVAETVGGFSAPAVAAIRSAVASAGPQVTEAGMAREGILAREIFQGEDCREGTAAFLEKRAPVFTGR
ncbi:enoyl-CoA hydratase/isomerase family protein [Chachezhania sediminis]|uniref:enoyl-CoA hydratase/isomerase family protein n=1 Tax=Chachezhania sediminis TaxID=2599291 RepID=UPI00131C5DAE|nr:enoyl-CoA hydratase/isomerase family protein [Chachezhania sediminis]